MTEGIAQRGRGGEGGGQTGPRSCSAKPAAAALCLVLAPLLATPAWAQTTRVVGYRYTNVWSSTVRLLRVDSRYKVTDKDRDNGYITFVYPGSGAVKECAASLELIRVDSPSGDASAPAVKLQLDIEHQPSYVELQLLDRLERKLEADYGPPRAPTDAPPGVKPPPKRRGDSGGGDSGGGDSGGGDSGGGDSGGGDSGGGDSGGGDSGGGDKQDPPAES
ncbi:MAG: hypothetical protein IPL40_14340 [Proteobacteria bacterium]|nr:hypothetical protein [Pseudomonadota bacterium]